MDSQPSGENHTYLPRLAKTAYTGHAIVHWSMALQNRSTGWLDESHHAHMRELLLHTCHRYELACPAYCLMPDHGHFLLAGIHSKSNQRLAIAWFRRAWNAHLRPKYELQRQAHDHVLRSQEIGSHGIKSIAHYILDNAHRANLTGTTSAWPFKGSIFPGVAPLDISKADHWERFWTSYNQHVSAVIV